MELDDLLLLLWSKLPERKTVRLKHTVELFPGQQCQATRLPAQCVPRIAETRPFAKTPDVLDPLSHRVRVELRVRHGCHLQEICQRKRAVRVPVLCPPLQTSVGDLLQLVPEIAGAAAE